jgi:hypothetical protein
MIDSFETDFLAERPEGQRIWVIRASGGAYAGHFVDHSLIAIGHVDKVQWPDGAIIDSQFSLLPSAFNRLDPERARSSITSHVNQVKTFIWLIREDDLVITVSADWFRVGRVNGEAYIAKDPLTITRSQVVYSMRHNLRRSVVWGPKIGRDKIPASLEMTMLAHQTVFNIDEHWDSIYHLLYPCFYANGKVYLSANIRQRGDLDNYSVSQFFSLLSGIEIMAKETVSESEEWETYPALSDTQLTRLKLNLTTKAEFMSPGAIWAAVSGTPATLLWVAVIYIMLFGGDIKIFKTDGLIDTKTRQKIWDKVFKLVEIHNFPRVKKDLKLEVPELETEPLKPVRRRTTRAKTAQKVIVVNKEPL